MPRFGSWSPDLPDLNNPGSTVANGVYPTNSGFKPFKGPTAITNALSNQSLGAFTFRRTDGVIETFVGDSTKLYRLGGTTFNDVSRAAGYNSEGQSIRWRFAIFGNIVIATNNLDAVQQFNVTTDSIFSDNAGAPIHSFPFVVRNFLVTADVNDGTQFQLKWSADNDSSKFTADCGGGAQEFPEGGPVVGGTGGETGIVFQESALSRMVFVGGDLRFTFDKLEGASGCIAAGSIVFHKGLTYYLAEDGFQIFDGAQSRNISSSPGGRDTKHFAISDTFFDNLDRANIDRMQGALDLSNDSIVWAYPTSSASAGENDKLIIFHIPSGDWSEADVVTQTILEDEISPNLLGNDAGPVVAWTTNRFYLGGPIFNDGVAISTLNISVGESVSSAIDIKTAGGASQGQLIITYLNAVSGGSTVLQTTVSGTVGSTAFERIEINGTTVPSGTIAISILVDDEPNDSATYTTQNAMFNVGATAREFGATDGKILASFDTDNKLARYSGDNIAAQIVTREFGQPRKFRVRSVRIDTDAPHTCTISHRRDQQDSVTSTSAVTVNGNGRCPIKANNRYQRFQLDIAAAASWTFADGFDSDGGPGGRIN